MPRTDLNPRHYRFDRQQPREIRHLPWAEYLPDHRGDRAVILVCVFCAAMMILSWVLLP
jgi:hypothetical protein